MMVMYTNDMAAGIRLESFNKEDKVCLCCGGGCADRPRATWGIYIHTGVLISL
jgi:hypothetical protein